MKRKKILFYIPLIFSRSGGELIVLEVVKRLRKKYEVDVMVHLYNEEQTFKEMQGLNILPLTRKKEIKSKILPKSLVLAIKIMLTKLPTRKYDLLMISGTGLAELIALRNHKIPSLYYCNSPFRSLYDKTIKSFYLNEVYNTPLKHAFFHLSTKAYGILEKISWKRIDKVCSISHTVKQRIIKARLKPEKQVSVIHLGVDTSQFLPSRVYKKYFFVPGRINKHKRQMLALEAFLLAKTDSALKDFKMVIAGNHSKKEEWYYQSILDESKRSADISVLPHDKDYPSLYRKAYTIVFTAMNEDFGLIPLEGAACAKPVISVNEGGPRETIIDQQTGFLVNATPWDLAKKMIELASNKDKVIKMGANARKHCSLFSWDETVKKLDLEIQKLLKKNDNDRVIAE